MSWGWWRLPMMNSVEPPPISTTSRLCPAVGRGVRGAEVDETGLFAAGDDFDGEPQGVFGEGQEFTGILGHPQVLAATARTAPASSPRRRSPKRRGLQGPRLGRRVEPLVGVEAGGQPDRLLEGIEGIDLVVDDPSDLQAKTVRTEVDRSYRFRRALS